MFFIANTVANKLAGWFGLKPTKAQLRARAAMSRAVKLRAGYDAAKTTPENAEHWAQADNLSARAANSLPIRRTLRSRARYEVANNSYAAGMLLTLANDVVGTGPRLQFKSKNSADNRKIEDAFKAWAREVRLAQSLRTMVVTKARDGEAFLKFKNNPAHCTPVQLDFDLLEGDQVTTPALIPTGEHIDGIWFDQWGNPSAYDVLERHPGDDIPIIQYVPDEIDASQMVHWFRIDRPGQKRGVPEITPALPLFAQLRRYTLAVLIAAETAADFAGVLKASSTNIGSDDADEVPPFDEIAIRRGILTAVPFGWDLSQLKAEQPCTTYGDFKREILNEIARCLCMPFNVAAGNSSGYNYSSGRLDHQVYFKAIGITQTECEDMVLDRLFRAWYAEARLCVDDQGQPLVPDISLTNRPWEWAWDPAEDLDPVKTAQARQTDLKSGALSIKRMYGQMGLDWEQEQLDQAECLGITVEQLRELLVQQTLGSAVSAMPTNDPSQDDDVLPSLLARRSRRGRRGSRIVRTGDGRRRRSSKEAAV